MYDRIDALLEEEEEEEKAALHLNGYLVYFLHFIP